MSKSGERSFQRSQSRNMVRVVARRSGASTSTMLRKISAIARPRPASRNGSRHCAVLRRTYQAIVAWLAGASRIAVKNPGSGSRPGRVARVDDRPCADRASESVRTREKRRSAASPSFSSVTPGQSRTRRRLLVSAALARASAHLVRRPRPTLCGTADLVLSDRRRPQDQNCSTEQRSPTQPSRNNPPLVSRAPQPALGQRGAADLRRGVR